MFAGYSGAVITSLLLVTVTPSLLVLTFAPPPLSVWPRYDLLCIEGLTRGLLVFLNKLVAAASTRVTNNWGICMCVCMHSLYVSQGKLVCINGVLANNKIQEGDELHVFTSSILCCLTVICSPRDNFFEVFRHYVWTKLKLNRHR